MIPEKKHDFVRVTLKKPTFCHHCSKFIWGMSLQGLVCSAGCGTYIHRKCCDDVTELCQPQTVKYTKEERLERMLSGAPKSQEKQSKNAQTPEQRLEFLLTGEVKETKKPKEAVRQSSEGVFHQASVKRQSVRSLTSGTSSRISGSTASSPPNDMMDNVLGHHNRRHTSVSHSQTSSTARKWTSCMVQSCDMDANGDWVFTIELSHENTESETIFRSYEEIWDLHVSLIEILKEEAGALGGERVIPFLEPPLERMPLSEANRRCKSLNHYMHGIWDLKGVWETNLLHHLLSSRPGDMMHRHSLASSDLLMDLMYQEHTKASLIIIHSDLAVEFEGTARFDEVHRFTCDHFFLPSARLTYKNEWGLNTMLRGETELQLLLEFRDTLKLYTI